MTTLHMLLAAVISSTIAHVFSAQSTPSGVQFIDLGGTTWSVSGDAVQVQGKKFPATVPGQIHTDLLASKAISDPYFSNNTNVLKWVALANWSYTRTFTVEQTALSKRVVQLVSMGIDTVADLYINEKFVAHTENMFHTIRLDIKRYLVVGENSIRVDFTSKVTEANNRYRECVADNTSSIICPERITNPCQHGYDNVNYLRTEPCSFSWDWGPGFAPVGLWRHIYIQAYDTAVVRDITVIATPRAVPDAVDLPAASYTHTSYVANASESAMIAHAFRRTDHTLDMTSWDATVQVYVDTGVSDTDTSRSRAAETIEGTVMVSLLNRTEAVPVRIASGTEQRVTLNVSAITGTDLPWYPNGHGEQPLHIVSAKFVPSSAGAPSPHDSPAPFVVPYPLQDNVIKGATGALSVRTGFRTVELVQEPLPGGKSYFFRINGIPIPVKGSNWIPADAFESRVSRNTPGTTRLEPLFVALQNSHQNMIRNWGGGIYQRDSFYDLADEHGIMIWEDLMWACAQYAVPPAYLQSAAKEVRDNVKRMQAQPSIVLWAGNNEDEKDLSQGQDVAHIRAYADLTFLTGLSNVSAIDTSRPLSGSSPSDGNETAEHPFSWNHQSEFYGDVHNYLYDVDSWDHTVYKRPRFMSEFGLQSWPSAITMSTVMPSEEWGYETDASTYRNHHPDGQQEMTEQISMHFHLPKSCFGSNNCKAAGVFHGWVQMLWLTQLNQALGYKKEVESFRRIRTECSETVPGCNMGRMYWQTNDIWPGASWAAVDYTGRYKMVQYFTQRFYAPFLVSAYANAAHGIFGASIINDDVAVAVSGEIRFTMHTWSGDVTGTWTVPYDAKPASATPVVNSSFVEMLSTGACPNGDATLCFLTFAAYNGSADDHKTPLSTNFELLTPFYDVTTMEVPDLQLAAIVPSDNRTAQPMPWEQPFDVTVMGAAATAFLWLETGLYGRWSDNGVLLPKADMVAGWNTTFYSDTTLNGVITAEQLRTSLNQPWKTGLEYGNLWSLADTNKEYTGGN
eukprot:m.542306 g.542306  ORF g.542306 m.542306 type:complete len:1018 (+) comp22116_c1_seq1:202-3255(+)